MTFPKPSWSLLIIVVALPLQVYFGASAVDGALRVYQNQREITAIRADLARLERRRHELEEQQLYLQSDQYIEKVAREQLNLIKPGDHAVVIIPGERSGALTSVSAPPPAPAAPAEEAKPEPLKWLDRFLGSGESRSTPPARPRSPTPAP